MIDPTLLFINLKQFNLGNICKLNSTYFSKLNQLKSGQFFIHSNKVNYLGNDLTIKKAYWQLRIGVINIKTFIWRCSFTIAEYEKRMRLLALGSKNRNAEENAIMNDDNEIIIGKNKIESLDCFIFF